LRWKRRGGAEVGGETVGGAVTTTYTSTTTTISFATLTSTATPISIAITSTGQTIPGNIIHSTGEEHLIPTEQRRAGTVVPLVESRCRTARQMRRAVKRSAAADNKVPLVPRVPVGRSKPPCANGADRVIAVRRREAPRTAPRAETASAIAAFRAAADRVTQVHLAAEVAGQLEAARVAAVPVDRPAWVVAPEGAVGADVAGKRTPLRRRQ